MSAPAPAPAAPAAADWADQPPASTTAAEADVASDAAEIAAADAKLDQVEVDQDRPTDDRYQAQLRLIQDDQESPLHSAAKFEELGLPESLLKGVYEMNFHRPSRIQGAALPLVLSNPPKSLMAQAQNGSGKTATFLLGVMARIDENLQQPQAIVLVPMRELAIQIVGVARKLAKYTGIKASALVPQDDRRARMPKQTAHILVGTTSTVLTSLQKKLVPTKAVQVLVLDEADAMLGEQRFREESISVRKLLGQGIQVLLFSATYTQSVISFVAKLMPHANKILLEEKELSIDRIKQCFVRPTADGLGALSEDMRRLEADRQKVLQQKPANEKALLAQIKAKQDELRARMHDIADGAKFRLLSDLYGLLTFGQSMIFVNSKKSALDLKQRMSNEGHQVSFLSSDLMPSERDETIRQFMDGRSRVLISTNVLARGVDVLSVTFVVNYDPAVDRSGRPDAQTYLHRIGRTGRFGHKGVALSFVVDDDEEGNIRHMEKTYECSIQQVTEVEELKPMLADTY